MPVRTRQRLLLIGNYGRAIAQKFRERVEEVRRNNPSPGIVTRQHLSALEMTANYFDNLGQQNIDLDFPADPLLITRQMLEEIAGRRPSGYEPQNVEKAVIMDLAQVSGGIEAPPNPREVLEALVAHAAYDARDEVRRKLASIQNVIEKREEVERELDAERELHDQTREELAEMEAKHHDEAVKVKQLTEELQYVKGELGRVEEQFRQATETNGSKQQATTRKVKTASG
jgi:hypothetical protein